MKPRALSLVEARSPRRPSAEEVAEAFAGAGRLNVAGITIQVRGDGLRIVDDERTHEATFAVLADRWSSRDLTRDLSRLVTQWALERPATDREAMRSGVAALSWSVDADPRWSVVVVRGRSAAPWLPLYSGSPKGTVERLALSRASRHPVRDLQIGESTIWTSGIHPVLSTAVLANRDWIERRQVRDEYIIVSPGRHTGVISAPYEETQRLRATIGHPLVVQHSSEVREFRWL